MDAASEARPADDENVVGAAASEAHGVEDESGSRCVVSLVVLCVLCAACCLGVGVLRSLVALWSVCVCKVSRLVRKVARRFA